jgi:UDP-3-O-[3-hydroxymyristoyl] N-acetylglucosamine deacetylase
MQCFQRTIAQKITIGGTGLHSGKSMEVTLSPGPRDTGVWFLRTDDKEARPVLAASENVSDTNLATSVGRGPDKVSTLEHLLAALGALGISNLGVELSGPEIPILDGSALPWTTLLHKAGVKTLNAPRPFYRVKKPFVLEEDGKSVSVEPSDFFEVDLDIEFENFAKSQSRRFVLDGSSFVKEIAPARTFCLEKDVNFMRANNLALGGGLNNAVVVADDGSILNPEGLRFPDEFVRHKILDFIGDMALAGCPILGRFVAHKTGHALNQRFLKNILNAPGILEKVSPGLEIDNFNLPLRKAVLAAG